MNTIIRPMKEGELESMMAENNRLNPERKVPQSTIDTLERYVEHRIEPGGFVRAVLENDLKEALGRADMYNRSAIFQIIGYCYNHIPSVCWGSVQNVQDWLENKQ